MIEHNHDFVKKISDFIWFLYDGIGIKFDNYESFSKNTVVKKTYLS